MFAFVQKVTRFLPLVIAAGMLVSCDTPQKRGLRELSKAGIQPSGMALLEAVERGDSLRAGWLVDVGVFTEQCDDLGRTPIRVAVETGDRTSALKLIDGKADVNATAADGVAILGIAVQRGESAIVKALLATGANTDASMPDGEKILPWTIRHGRPALARAMVDASPDPNLHDNAGNPVLHIALENGHRELAEAILKHGADAGTRDAAGESTLHCALRGGLAELAPQLVAAGATPDAAGADGLTLLDQAIAAGNASQVSLLLELGADPHRRPATDTGATPLERAFQDPTSEVFEAFLDRGVKPAGGNWDRYLWLAFARGQRDAIKVLVRHGANPDVRADGFRLIEAAAIRGDGTLIKFLSDYGCPLGNALYYASARGDAQTAGLLLACGAPVNATVIPTLDTPLAVALRHQRDRAATLLIHHGANLSLRLPEGQPPLHLAIATGCLRATRALLDAGADPNQGFELPVSPEFLKSVRPGVMRWVLKNDKGATPLMLAADSGSIPLTRTLIDAGAKRSIWTKTARLWPINFASRRDDVPMMRLFLGRDPQRDDRIIEINLSQQRARILDADGKEIYATKVSTGKKGFATPTGEFVITNKYRDWKSTIYNEASMPYFQRFSCGDFGMHQGSVPGYPASHGCIRIPAGNAAKMFTMTQAGDRVRILP